MDCTIAEKYQVFNSLLTGIQVVDPAGNYLYVNEAFVKQAGLPEEVLLTLNIKTVYDGIDNTVFFEKMQRCISLRQVEDTVMVFPKKLPAPYNIRLQPVAEGVLIQSINVTAPTVTGLANDAADTQKEALLNDTAGQQFENNTNSQTQAVTLINIKNIHQAILDNTTDSIVLISPQHEVLCFNNELKNALLSYFNKQIHLGCDYREFVIEANKALYIEAHQKGLQGETVIVENETTSGDISIWFQYKVNPVYDEQKKLLGIALTATNIDARKRKEIALAKSEQIIKDQAQKLAASENYYRTLIETSSDAVVLLSKEGFVIYSTPSTERITGFTTAEICNTNIFKLVHPDDRAKNKKLIEELLTAPAAVLRLKHRLRKKNNEYIWVFAVYRNMLFDKNINAIVFNFADINEAVLFEHELEKANRELTLLNKINDLILRGHNEEELCKAVCDCIVSSGQYKLAWVCYKPKSNDPNQQVVPATAAGETGYLNSLKISLNNPEYSNGPTASVLKTGKTAIVNNVSTAENFKPWLQNACKYGILASISLLLDFDNGNTGALMVYSAHANAFDEHETAILERLANNLSLAVRSIRGKQEILYTKHLLRERIKELTTIYKVNNILQHDDWPFDKLFTEIVALLPAGWQYPEICEAYIHFDGHAFKTPGYTASKNKQVAEFTVNDGRKGFIEIIYTKDTGHEHEGPFLKEERDLINSIAEVIELHINKIVQKSAMAESEARFRSAFDYAAIGKAIVSLNGRWTRVNQAFCSMVGYTEEELSALSFQDITYPDDLEGNLLFIQQAISSDINYYRTEKRFFHKDGSIVWVKLNVCVIRDEQKRPLYFVSQMENITSKKKSEDALVKSQANLKSIFENTAIGYLLLDKNCTIIALNDKMKKLYYEDAGFLLAEGASFIDLLQPLRKPFFIEAVNTVVASGQPYRYEAKYTTAKDDKYYSIDLLPVTNNGNVIGFCFSAYDISTQKSLEIEKQAMIHDLIQRNRDLEQFSNILSHNVRGPLSTILGLTSLLKEETDRSVIEMCLHGTEEAAQQLDGVIRDLNEILHVKYSLAEAKVKVNLASIAEEVKRILASYIADNGAVVTCNFDNAPQITTIKAYIKSIFYNLISNAIKYAKKSERPNIRIASFIEEGKTVITFTDNGLGFDLNKYGDQVFTLNRRFHPSVKGKGLGLYMVKMQVLALNGTIDLESTPGEGSVFTIKFNP